MVPESLPHPKHSSSLQQSRTGSHPLLSQRTSSQMWLLHPFPRLEHLNEIDQNYCRVENASNKETPQSKYQH